MDDGAPRTVAFDAFCADLQRRRDALEPPIDEAEVDAMRNKGHRRTASKKALLHAIAETSRAAGLEPPVTYIDGERI